MHDSDDGYDGYILIDKPRGWTSFDVVAKVRSLVKKSFQSGAITLPDGQTAPKRIKVGHTGTLDPLATGLLVVLIGKYTRRATELTKLDKTYEVTMKLGEISTTGDEEGEKTKMSDRIVDLSEIKALPPKFTGNILQTPPIFSAMKVNGVRAYKLAREGKEVVMEPRPAKINSIQITSYDYPLVTFTADVSSGTYIRSLVEDIGKELGTGAYMSDLRRTRVGQFNIEDAIGMEGLSPEALLERRQWLHRQG